MDDIADAGTLIVLFIRVVSKRRHIHVAEYYGHDMNEAYQMLGQMARRFKARGLTCKSYATRPPLAASVEIPLALLPQISTISPPATESNSPPQPSSADGDVESIFDDMSDCKNLTFIYPLKRTNVRFHISGASFVSAISELPANFNGELWLEVAVN